MKAILLPGHAEVRLTERPTPAPGSNEVLVRVQASALCRSDLISHRFELGDAAEAFALFQARRTDKVVFVPWTIS